MATCDELPIGRLLYLTARIMTAHAEKVLKPYDLTVEQLHLLKSIEENATFSQQQHCDIVEKSAANVTRILDRLERKGCVRRGENPTDRRSTLLHITDQGRKLIDDVTIVLESFADNLTHGISPEEQTMFIQLLHKIQDNLHRNSK
jgi:DNA-binding MarR family transcriptional regulator